jgi:glycosyltransferase involved in cell wall biosynthesis
VARILFVVNDPAFFVSHRLPIGVAARRLGHDVHVAAPPGDGRAQIEARGLTLHEIPLARSSAQPWEEVRTLLALDRLYARLRPHLVHHVTIKPVLYGGWISRARRVPAVVHAICGLGYVFLAGGWRAAARRAAVRVAYRRAFGHPNTRVIFQNEDDRSVFVDAGLVHRGCTEIIRGSGVDLDRFRPSVEPLTDPVVLFPGRMLADKGVRELAAAARALRREGVRVKVMLAGPADHGNPASVTERELRAWEAAGDLSWLGPRDDMPDLMRRAHVVCLPSYREGTPKALLEAAASARAIVTTDVPGCREVVRDGENGLLVPPRDAAALARALRALVTDPQRRARMGARGRAIAEAHFAVEAVIERTLAVHDALLAAATRLDRRSESAMVS